MKVMALVIACLLFFSPFFAHACSYNVVQSVSNSWQENGVEMIQYDIVVTNTADTLYALNFYVSTSVSQFWSATQNGDGSLGLPAWFSSGFSSGATWSWGLVTAGPATLSGATNPAGCAVNYKGGGSGGGSNGGGGGGSNTASTFCTGNPPSYNGLPCASTTRYFDGTTGACGCGYGDNGPFSWQRYQYTAAGSQALFGDGTWCGGGCGSCYEITPTGDCPTGAPCATSTSSIVVMISNLCPNAGNAEWCPNPGQTNQHGYAAHFDLMDSAQVISNLGWNNPVVTYRQVACGSSGSPSCTDASQCQCGTSQCGVGGIATYSQIKNVTYVDEPDPKKPATHSKDTKNGLPSYATAIVIVGIFVAIAALGGIAFFVLRKHLSAPLTPRMEPLLDYTENSDI